MLRTEVDGVVADFALFGCVGAVVWYVEVRGGIWVDWVAKAGIDGDQAGALVRLND